MSEELEKEDSPEANTLGKKRLSSADWREIEVHWEYGTMKTKEIVDRWGVHRSTISAHFADLAKKGIVIKKNAKKHLAVAAVNATVSSPPPSTRAPSEFEDKRKDRIEQVKELMFKQGWAIGIHTAQLQKKLNDGTLTWVAASPDLKSLRLAGQVLDLNRKNLYAVLDVENDINEADLPILEFQDLTAAEIKSIQEGGDDDPLDGLEDPDEDDVIEEGKPS